MSDLDKTRYHWRVVGFAATAPRLCVAWCRDGNSTQSVVALLILDILGLTL